MPENPRARQSREVARAHDEATVDGHLDVETPKPKRLSLSQIVELMLTRGTGERSTVTLNRTASGETSIEVKVRTGENGEVVTVEDAEHKALDVYERLRARYPLREGHDNASVSLKRNAKGETQVEATIHTSDDGEVRTVEDAEAKVLSLYDSMRCRYPMADGTTAAPGSVAP